jgi:polysaccharide export outer membrane protein
VRPSAKAILLAVLLAFIATSGAQAQNAPVYVLDTGDRVRITVFGHEDLSGEFEVSSNGNVSMPLIGEIHAEGLSTAQLEARIIDRLKPDYLKNPQVSAEVINYRPFYIIGEVQNPGTYPYVGGMRVVNAVAMAGGFTYRADEDDILVTRADGDGTPVEVGPQATVLPGDVIEVQERFF